jgi:chemotaxis family two-component system sensor kinase Cph1
MVLLLELEPVQASVALDGEQTRQAMSSVIHRLESADSVEELAQGLASKMRELTGFDRVWVYRFHPDWHGEIIGEARRDDIESWIGMHYPASDIPMQARALFLRNWVRIIPDLGFVPSPLEPLLNPETGAPLDLGGSVLRSVSPIHVQYLRNMGVTASLVISLIHRGTLWGLISGHHYSGPKRVPVAQRTLCEFIAQALSLQIGTTERVESRDRIVSTRERQSVLIGRLRDGASLQGALTEGSVTMRDLVAASGAAIVREEQTHRSGATPDEAQIAALVAWLRATAAEGFYETVALARAFASAQAYADSASGLLALALSNDRRDWLLWFRAERRQTVRWAGDPRKPVTIGPDGSSRLHPRGSFELWEEEAQGTSLPWLPIEIDAARDLRRAVLDRLIRNAEEVTRLNLELRLANAQLEGAAVELELQADELINQRAQRETILERERFARLDAEGANRAKADFLAVMSHELRTPLNAIGGYAQLMSLGVRGEVNDQQRADLDRIQFNQRHLLGLINSMLNFTKLEAGAIQFVMAPVSARDMLEGMDSLIGPQMRAKPLLFSVNACDQRLLVSADENKLRQILVNLLTNSLKFTPPNGKVSVDCRAEGERVTFEVRDTGRGIVPASLESIFDPFVQVDRQITPTVDQGVGLGLAISRELARGMGGELMAESTPGIGSVFTLTLHRAS